MLNKIKNVNIILIFVALFSALSFVIFTEKTFTMNVNKTMPSFLTIMTHNFISAINMSIPLVNSVKLFTEVSFNGFIIKNTFMMYPSLWYKLVFHLPFELISIIVSLFTSHFIIKMDQKKVLNLIFLNFLLLAVGAIVESMISGRL